MPAFTILGCQLAWGGGPVEEEGDAVKIFVTVPVLFLLSYSHSLYSSPVPDRNDNP